MLQNFFKLFLFLSVSFASVQGFSHPDTLEGLYEKKLKPAFEKIKPLQEYAKKRQTTYIISAVLAIVVFAMFVKYFKLLGALVAIIMIAGGIFYLKKTTSAITPYKSMYNQQILSPIGKFCCGYSYKDSAIGRSEVLQSNLFSAKFKNYDAQGLFIGKGVRFGYVDITFDTKENESVERFAENTFSGFVVMLDRKNKTEGVMVSDAFKEKVADIDPEFSAFFSKLPRSGKSNGFELFGKIAQEKLDHCHTLASKEVAISFTHDKTYLFWVQKNNPFAENVYANFDLQHAQKYVDAFKAIDVLIHTCDHE